MAISPLPATAVAGETELIVGVIGTGCNEGNAAPVAGPVTDVDELPQAKEPIARKPRTESLRKMIAHVMGSSLSRRHEP
jgi:hypothetical protein